MSKGESGRRYDGRSTRKFKRLASIASKIRWGKTTIEEMEDAKNPAIIDRSGNKCTICQIRYPILGEEYCPKCEKIYCS